MEEGMLSAPFAAKTAQTSSTRNAEYGGAVAGATPEEIKAAVARLLAKGLKVNKVNVAEEIANPSDAQPPAAPSPMPMEAPPRGPYGGNPSPELVQNIKDAQREKNRLFLERVEADRRKKSGAR